MNEIDFVITWVDGSDPAWQAQRRKFSPEKSADDSEDRYRDWENLQYWFRGIEKFTPWVNRIFFVTWGHVPKWLNTEHPRLSVIRHEEYIPEKYLPTFSSHPIELNLHRISGLSEQFVYFNDDTFLLRPMKEEEFFKKGLPRDCCIETALVQNDIRNPFGHILMNNAAIVNMHYNKKQVIKKQPGKWFHPAYGLMAFRNLLMFPYQEFSGFKYTHQPSPFLKSTYLKLWEEEGDVLDEVCAHKFRSFSDVNQYLLKHWQCMEGKFVPQSPKIGRFYTVGKDDAQIHRTIRRQSVKMLCINDDAEVGDFRIQKEKLIRSFEQILPEKSSFEK